MATEEFVKRRVEAADEFNQHEDRSDGVEISGSLAGGLTILRDSLYKRLHEDVQRRMGMDSILAPICEEKSERLAKIEIELYQIAVSAATARAGDYVDSPDGWYWQWLTRLRLGPLQPDAQIAARIEHYLGKSRDEGRLVFTNVMSRALPESRRAPLVMFRLAPLAVQIVTALAFGDSPRAERGSPAAGGPPAGHQGLPPVSRHAAGKRRAVSRVRQSALAVRLAQRGRLRP